MTLDFVAPDEKLLHTFLEANPTTEFVRYHWLDYAGIFRQRILPKEHVLRLLSAKKHYGVGPALMQMTIADQWLNPPPRQEVFHLRPDWSSLRVCHFAPAHAFVMCYAYCDEAQNPLQQCPRNLLASVLRKYEKELDIKFKVGFEIEWVLLDSSMNPARGLDDMEGWASAAGLRDGKLQCLEEIVRILHASDIEVYHFHSEERHQLELSTGPLPPMEAVDALLYTHEVIKCISIKHGWRATMVPRPMLVGTSTGAHPHISMTPHNLQDYFLAGILENLPVLCAFGMSTTDSYWRVRDSIDGTGTWVCWGTQNRDVPIRKINDGHWEMRFVDAGANFYMLLASILHAGLGGIQEKKQLTWKDLRFFTASITNEERTKLGITERLPSSLKQSLMRLRECDNIKNFLGAEMFHIYTTLKEMDDNVLSRMPDDERRKVLVRYF